jgi:hypothetical protein
VYYEDIYDWAVHVGQIILDKSDKGEDLVKRLIYDIRGEDLPGRFLDKLSGRLTEYKTNKNIAINVSMYEKLYKNSWYGDSFRYVKSAILSGFLNSLASSKIRERTGGE